MDKMYKLFNWLFCKPSPRFTIGANLTSIISTESLNTTSLVDNGNVVIASTINTNSVHCDSEVQI